MSDISKFKSVQEYFSAQPEKTKAVLFELRKCILDAAPGAVESINYNIPAYALVKGGNRDQQIMIAGYKNHVGLYPSAVVMKKFDGELEGYKRGKGSIQFPLDQPLPTELIKRMLVYRLELLREE